jgi:alpha-tubulin suppressor-like RCC1 family protein
VDDYLFRKGDDSKTIYIDNFNCINPKKTILFQKKIKKFACGDGYTMCLDNDGVVYSWGKGDNGQLGYELRFNDEDRVSVSTSSCQRIPRVVEAFKQKDVFVIDIFCGKDFSFVIAKNNLVYSFGNNVHGQLGRERNVLSLPEPLIANLLPSGITKIALSWMHGICLTEKGNVFIWGNPYFDYDPKQADMLDPIEIEFENKVSDIASGFHHCAALVGKGHSHELYTWGVNDYVYYINIGTTRLYD